MSDIFESSQLYSPESAGHTNIELANVYKARKVEREWRKSNNQPSSHIIKVLHHTLFNGVESYAKKGITPNEPGVFRREDLVVAGEPENFYVRGTDVGPIMRDYTDSLDRILQTMPKAPLGHVEQIINNAAWAYYVFIRIHPFLDGNGRLGRMVMQRILGGAGFKDIIFVNEAAQGTRKFVEKRTKGLDAMNQVDASGSLNPLEIYIAELLKNGYSNLNEANIKDELDHYILTKRRESAEQNQVGKLSQIWSRFGYIDIHGGGDLEFERPLLKTPIKS